MKKAPSGFRDRGKSSSFGKNTNSGSNNRGQVSTRKSIFSSGKLQSRASFFSSSEMSQSLEYRRRYKNNFLHSSHVRNRESSVSSGIKSVLNGGTAESSTEIRVLEKE